MAMPGYDLWNPLKRYSSAMQGGASPADPKKKKPYFEREGMFGLDKGTLMMGGLGLLAGDRRSGPQMMLQSLAHGMNAQSQRRKDAEREAKANQKRTTIIDAMRIKNPQERRVALAAAMPEQAAQIALQRAFQPAPERKIIKGADGINYYQDTQERVLPDVQVPQAPRQMAKGADGFQYYIDSGERVLPNVKKPPPVKEDPWSAIAMGDGNAVLYNRRTGENRQFGGQPVQAASGEDPNALFDDFSSPFEGQDFAPYGGALLTPTSFGDQFSGEGLPPLVTGGEGAPTGRKPTEFDKVRDREAAKDLVEWQLGGQARAATQLGILKEVITELESGKNVSGPWVGNLPLKSITAPNAKDVEARVASVVQQSLKAILGGQFAEREAQDLLKRAYDPTLDEKINAARLKTLYDDLVYRSQINDYAARYAEQYGTLEGVDAYLAQLGDHSPMQTPQNLESMSDDDLLRSLGLQ